MKILFVTHTPPVPPTDGASLIVANLARELSAAHTLFLVTFSEREGTAADMGQWFAKTHVVPSPYQGSSAKLGKWLSSVTDPLPMWVRGFTSEAMCKTVGDAAKEFEPDVIHLNTAKMAQYVDAVAQFPTVIAPHDSLTMVLHQWQTSAPDAGARIYARLQVGKMRRFEASQYRKGDLVCVVTEKEKEFLQALDPTLSIRVIPIGVDTDYFAPIAGVEKAAHIGFSGVMDYIPNRRAALYFAREVMPHIWQAVPDAVFTIIGRNPTSDILALTQEPRIRVTGTVEDVRPCLAEQQVMVVPMPETGGIKIKLLEAMAMGKAIVTTREGLEGIDVRPGHDVLVGADSSGLATACIELLRDAALREQLGQNARALALKHSWSRTAAHYLDLYREAIHAAARR